MLRKKLRDLAFLLARLELIDIREFAAMFHLANKLPRTIG
jgi:hypothetical protein